MRFFEGLERAGREVSAVVLGKALRVQKTSLAKLQAAMSRGEVRKILLVRNYQGMGDLLCTSPVIGALKIRFPDASIHFLANTFNAAALQNHPGLSKVWAWDERRKASPWHWLYFRKHLRREKFDLALVLTGNALSLTAMLLAALSGARWVVGYETAAYGESWGPRLYSYEVPYRAPVREIDKYAGLLEGLGITVAKRIPEFFVRTEESMFADSFWTKAFPSNGRPVVGIFLGGKVDRPDRIWPAENYARIARDLAEKMGCAILAITPPVSGRDSAHRREATFWMDEEVHEREFMKAYGKNCPVFRDADLGRVAAVLKKLALFICPDGGMMHLAAAVGAPALTLFFGTDPEIWHPAVDTSYFVRAPGQDPKALAAADVTQKAVEILGHHENH